MVRGLKWLVWLGCVCCLSGCSERSKVESALREVPDLSSVVVGCGQGMFGGDDLCLQVTMKDHSMLKFEHVGAKSLGPNATIVFISEAGGLVPRVASCDDVGPPNFHRDSPLGRHFHPTLIDLKDAVFRYREVLEEVEFWPQCPQYWEVQDKRGQNYRYCARKKDVSEEPPKPDCP